MALIGLSGCEEATRALIGEPVAGGPATRGDRGAGGDAVLRGPKHGTFTDGSPPRGWGRANGGRPARAADYLNPPAGVPVYSISVQSLGKGSHEHTVTDPVRVEPGPFGPGGPKKLRYEISALGWGYRVSYRQTGGPPVRDGEYGGSLYGALNGQRMKLSGMIDDHGQGSLIGPSGTNLVVFGSWYGHGDQAPSLRAWAAAEAPQPGWSYLVSNVAVVGSPPGDAPVARDLTPGERADLEQFALPVEPPPPGLDRVEPDAAVWRGVPVTAHDGRDWTPGVVESVARTRGKLWTARVEVRLDRPDRAGRSLITVPVEGAEGDVSDRLVVDADARLAAAGRPEWFDPANPVGPHHAENLAFEAQIAAKAERLAAAKKRAEAQRAEEHERFLAQVAADREARDREFRTRDYPIRSPIPPKGEPIPEDLALPPDTAVYYQWPSNRWTEVRTAAEDVADLMEVRRSRGPSSANTIFIPRAQLVVEKSSVRILRRAQRTAEAAGEPVPHVRVPPEPEPEPEPEPIVAGSDGSGPRPNMQSVPATGPLPDADSPDAGSPDSGSPEAGRPAPARDLDSYPATIDPPAGSRFVPDDLIVPGGTRLQACWGRSWRDVTVLRADPGGPIEISWDGYGASWNGWLPRGDLVVRDDVAAKLRRTQDVPNDVPDEQAATR